MRALPTVTLSSTRDDLVAQIDSVHATLVEFYREVPAEFLLTSADPDGWSVAKNMRHIASTNRLMAHWIGMPAAMLRMLGRPREHQQTVEELVPTNRPHVKDHGSYHPGRLCHAKRKERLLACILESADKLKRAVTRRREEELDRLRGPFGGMSMRIFVHFVLRHNVYHSSVVRARLAAAQNAPRALAAR